MLKGKQKPPSNIECGPLQPSAFTTQKLVEEAAAEAIPDRLSDRYRNFHGVSPGLGGLSSFGPIYLSGGELKQRGNKKDHFPERKKWPTIASDT
jgi:hypothetical protein